MSNNPHASNQRMTNLHHDSSIDAAVISEFNRRFPALTFLSFYRNCSSQALHVLRCVGLHADLVAAGIPVRADMKRSTGAPDQLSWYVTRDRRRKVGMLVATLWLNDGALPADHPMAWLEPRNWTSGQDARGASAQWTSADLAAAAKAWADTYGRREKVTQAQPMQIPLAVAPAMTAGTVLRHERFERAPVQPQRRRGRLPQGVVSIRGRRVNLRLGDRAELVGYTTRYAEDNGKRVRIVDVDVGRGWVGVRSLDGVLRCDDGAIEIELDVKLENLRRLWAGLTEDERAQLRLWRGES